MKWGAQTDPLQGKVGIPKLRSEKQCHHHFKTKVCKTRDGDGDEDDDDYYNFGLYS